MNKIFDLKARLKKLRVTIALLEEAVPDIDWTSLKEECREIEQAIAQQDQLDLFGGEDEQEI
jgi:hypothetical protein